MTAPVLHLIDTGGPGGAETVFLNLATGIGDARFQSICVVSNDGWLAAQLRTRGHTPLIIPSKGSMNFGYLRALRRIVHRHKVGLIVAHLYGSSIYGSLAGRLCGIPVISILHGQTDTAGEGRLGFLKKWVVRRYASRVVFVSERLRQTLAPELGLDAARCIVIPNGVDLARFRPQAGNPLRGELGLAASTRLVGAIGNIRAPKAYDVLLRAAQLLLGRGMDCHFAIAGQGSGQLMSELLLLRRELDLERNVTFLGLRADVPELLASFDVYALSSNTEGFSIACVEAMASGVPVVATRSGGPEEIIQDGESGLLVPTGSPDALADAIERFITDTSLASAIAEQGTLRARQYFSLQSMLKGYAQVFDSLHKEVQR